MASFLPTTITFMMFRRGRLAALILADARLLTDRATVGGEADGAEARFYRVLEALDGGRALGHLGIHQHHRVNGDLDEEPREEVLLPLGVVEREMAIAYGTALAKDER